MKKYIQRGFTLMELLVVIAIIGILASVVLASLNTAREKGRAASAQASASQMRAQAELGVDNAGTYLANLCTVAGTTAGGLATLTAAVTANGGTAAVCAQNAAAGTRPSAWGYAFTLPTGSNYCVDSTGYAGVSTAAPATEITATTDVVCDNS